MTRRDFLNALATAYGVVLTQPSFTAAGRLPSGERDYVSDVEAAREATKAKATVTLRVVFLDDQGREALTRDHVCQVVDDGEVVTLEADPITWEAVPPGPPLDRLVAYVPLGDGASKRVEFPVSCLPLYPNGGNITLIGLKVAMYG